VAVVDVVGCAAASEVVVSVDAVVTAGGFSDGNFLCVATGTAEGFFDAETSFIFTSVSAIVFALGCE